MSVVQSSYTENITDAINGQVANTQTCDADTYIAAVDAIPYGRAVQEFIEPYQATLGAAGQILGISVKDPTRYPGDDDTYRVGAHMAVAYRGDIWIEPDGFVRQGQRVTADAETGRLGVIGPLFTVIAGSQWDAGDVVDLDNETLEWNGVNIPLDRVYGLTGTPTDTEVADALERDLDEVLPTILVSSVGGVLRVQLGLEYNPGDSFTGRAAKDLGFDQNTQVSVSRSVVPGARWMTDGSDLAIVRLGTHQSAR